MAENNTSPHPCDELRRYRVGETVVFKFEGNFRAVVRGHEIVKGRVWLWADSSPLSFLVPASDVICIEPSEEGAGR
jgi:hypothetical protein